MAAFFVSDQAQLIEYLSLRVRNIVLENDRGMDRATRDVVISALVDAIRGIQQISVRRHVPPDISEDSSWNENLQTLETQTLAESIVADEMHLGPAYLALVFCVLFCLLYFGNMSK